MIVLHSKKELVHFIKDIKQKNKSIGFAPTMGALHEGHLSLYKKARRENDIVVSSIFVNPTQFNNKEDLEKYPRNINRDITTLEKSTLVDAVYIPTIEDIYPNKTESRKYDFGGIENEMEGSSRPGHFDGVGTVVEELLRQVIPDNAYFGEKDFQQLAIIKKLVEITHLETTIHGIPIHREKSGLAMSSRNERLSEKDREDAKIIYATLQNVNKWKNSFSLEEIKEKVASVFHQQPHMELEYFLIANEETLKEVDTIDPLQKNRAFIVVLVGGIRLIDNLHIG